MPADDTIFGLLALRAELISPEQLGQARFAQRKAKKEKGDRPSLRRVLIEKGFVTATQASDLDEEKSDGLIPGYEILDEIGRGGMGVVYKARQISMDRPVAIKVLARKLSADKSFIKKFIAEAKSAAKLNHGNIITAIDVGEAEDLYYFVMEYVPGKEVADVIEEKGKLETREAFEIALQIAQALEHASAHRIVHRDIKPENIMIAEDGVAKLCDLGLARPIVEDAKKQKTSMTEGTPYYVSPEQAMGQTDLDSRSDFYSLGATLYHMLSGKVPYDGKGPGEIMWKQVHKPFPDLEKNCPGLSPAQYSVLGKMVEKDRHDRHESPKELIVDLFAAARPEAARASTRARAEAGGSSADGKAAGAGSSKGLVIGLAAAAAVLILVGLTVAAFALGGGGGPNPDGGGEVAGAGEGSGAGPTDASGGGGDTSDPDDPGGPGDDDDDGGRPIRVDPAGGSGGSGGTDTGGSRSGDASTSPEIVAARETAARELLGDPNASASDDPRVLADAIGRFDHVLGKFDGTAAAALARTELGVTQQKLQQIIDAFLKRAGGETGDALKAGRFGQAEATLAEVRESLGQILLAVGSDKDAKSQPGKRARRDLTKLCDAAVKAVGARLKQVETQAVATMTAAIDRARKAPNAAAGLAELDAAILGATEGTRATAEPVLAELSKRARTETADAAIVGAFEQVLTLLASGRVDEARGKARAAAASDALAPVAARARGLVSVVDAFAGGERSLRESIVTADRITFPLADGSEIEGTVKRLAKDAFVADIKVAGRKDPILGFALDQLADDFLVASVRGAATDAASMLRSGVFLGVRGHPVLGLAELDRARAAGASVPAEVEAWLRARLERERLAESARAIEAALAIPAEEHGKALRALEQAAKVAAGTDVLRTRSAELQAHFIEARARALVADDVGDLFRGEVEERSRGVLRITYEWKDDAEMEDWEAWGNAGPSDDPNTASIENRRLVLDGRPVRHVGLWSGDISLSVTSKPRSKTGANINLRICDDTTGNAYLAGFGHRPQGKNRVQVDPAAPLRPGWNVKCPATVIVRTVPKSEDWRYLFADDKTGGVPPNRSVTVRLTRGRGAVNGYLGRRKVASWKETPDTIPADPGRVGVSPFNTALQVEKIVIEGRLDEAWALARARTQADVEAKKLFPSS